MPARLQVGSVFAGRFRVERPLAEGGMGVLYAVTNLATGHACALKVLNAEGCFDDEVRKRFLDEARNTPSDASDHIVRVLDAGIADGVPWVLMELLEGATLTHHVARHGPMAPDELRDVFLQLCHGLAAAHARGLVHRDLKPDNVFLQLPRSALGGRFVKVLDFGVAKALGPSQTRGAASVIVGTQGWWAPEQMLGGMISPATDVWALGLLAYWCLTGRTFHETAQRMEVTATERAREQGAAGRVPPGLDPWFAGCLAWEPTRRFRDASAAWRALDASLPRYTPAATAPTALASAPAAPPSVTPPPVPLPTTRLPGAGGSRRAVALAVGVLVAAIAAAVGMSARSTTTQPDHAASAPPVAPPLGGASTAQPPRTVATTTDAQGFLRQWDALLHALARGEFADVGSFYAERTRIRGWGDALQTRVEVNTYWAGFFRQRGTIQFEWARAEVVEEALDATRDSHRACALVAGAEPRVTHVRVPAVEDNPQSGVQTREGTRCTHVEGVYLLRLVRAGGGWQLCHDSWSLREAICPSCPTALACGAAGAY